jgi:cytochrome c553
MVWVPLCLPIASLHAQDRSAAELMSRAAAASPDVAQGADLFKRHCKECHGSQGSGTRDREFPQLAGQQRLYLLGQLTQFISLERYGPQMHRVLAQVADPQSLSDLAAYLAAQAPDPHGEHGDWHQIGVGRSLYSEHCAKCHGAHGEGRAAGPIPAVGGQNYTYLAAQLKGFAVRHGAKVDEELIKAVNSLSAAEQQSLADFMSRMPQSVDAHYGVVN